MASLAHTSRTLLRALPRSGASFAARALSTSAVKAAGSSSFDSPFKGQGGDATSKIPDFSHYRSKSGSGQNLLFQYFMVGSMGALTAAGAKATVQGTWKRGTKRVRHGRAGQGRTDDDGRGSIEMDG